MMEIERPKKHLAVLLNQWIAVKLCNVAEASQNTYPDSAFQPLALS
jgi:hypothetical protein